MLNIYVEERVARLRQIERHRALERQRQLDAARALHQAEQPAGKRQYSRALIWLGKRMQAWGKRLDNAEEHPGIVAEGQR
jgi:hypothetical protein